MRRRATRIAVFLGPTVLVLGLGAAVAAASYATAEFSGGGSATSSRAVLQPADTVAAPADGAPGAAPEPPDPGGTTGHQTASSQTPPGQGAVGPVTTPTVGPVPTATSPAGAQQLPAVAAGSPVSAASMTQTSNVSSSPQTVRGNDGSLSAVLSATPADVARASAVSFVLYVTDSSATGPVGPASLSYGDGQPAPQTGAAASCHVGASSAPVSETFDYSHSYAAPGTYSVSVTVSAPCSSESVVLEVPITVSAV